MMSEFRMPSLGVDMESGTILEWRVKPGDAVTRGDVIAVVQTDKSDIDVEVFTSGVIDEILVAVGIEVPVGAPLAIVRDHVTAPASPVATSPALKSPAPAQPRERTRARVMPPLVEQRAERPRVSPYARRRANELGIDLTGVSSGPGDAAIHARDLEQVPRSEAEREVAAQAAPRIAAPGGLSAAVGQLMARSKREIPHYYLSYDIDLKQSLDWMRARNAELPVERRLISAALLLRAVVLASQDVPELNGHYLDGTFRPSDAVHLAIAVAVRGGGLLAPVIRGADALALDELMAAMLGAVGRARQGKLRTDDVAPATITVTNLGDQGVDGVWGVIIPPQVAIVGFGRVADRPWAQDGLLGVRPIVRATLSGDHRVSHGHPGARFLTRLGRHLENPEDLR